MKFEIPRILRVVSVLMSTFTLVACAGGGGSGSSSDYQYPAAITGAPVFSSSSVVQGGSITATIPVNSGTGYVAFCVSPSLTVTATSMCGGAGTVNNSATLTVNIDPGAIPGNTYWLQLMVCANLMDCINGVGMDYLSNSGASTYSSVPVTPNGAGSFTDTKITIPEFTVTSSSGTGVIPGGITAAPVITPSTVSPGETVNVSVAATADTGWVQACVHSALNEWGSTNYYGCGGSAVSSGVASIDVILDNPAPVTTTYWVMLLACNTEADCTNGTGLEYNSYLNSGSYYSFPVVANAANGAATNSGYSIPFFAVTPALVSADYTSPTAISLSPANPQFQIGAGAAGYVTFTTSTGMPYGIYLTDLSNAISPLGLTVSYDDGFHNPVAVAADGLRQNNLVTLGFGTDVVSHAYVVRIDNTAGTSPVTFSIQAAESLGGGSNHLSATPLAMAAPIYVGGEVSNAWFSFVPDSSSATMTISELTQGMNVDLIGSDGSTVLTSFASTQNLSGSQKPFNSWSVTAGNTYYLRISSQSSVPGTPTIGLVTLSSP